MTSRQEKALTLVSRVNKAVSGIKQQAEDLSARVDDGKEAVAHWGRRARRFVRKNPAEAIFGSFVLGFALAKVARHV